MAGVKPKNFLGNPCKECGIILDENNFVANGSYIKSICKKCWIAQTRRYQAKNQDIIRFRNLKKFGITPEEYNKRLQSQLDGCAICKKPCATGKRLAVDHDHSTNQLRELLCQRCNLLLGLINEDIQLLYAIIEYLKKHQVEIG